MNDRMNEWAGQSIGQLINRSINHFCSAKTNVHGPSAVQSTLS